MRYVKINKDRGYLPGCYQVINENEREYKLKLDGGSDPFWIYKVQTYKDIECLKKMVTSR